MEDVGAVRSSAKDRCRLVRQWGPAVLWGALIFLLSSLPAAHLGAFPDLFPHVDKVGHLVIYGILGLLVFRGLSGTSSWSPPRRFALTVGIVLLYGALDEAHQALVPGRSPELLDLAMDLTGALIFASSWWLWTRRPRRVK